MTHSDREGRGPESKSEQARERLDTLKKEFTQSILANDVLFEMVRDMTGIEGGSSLKLPSFSMDPWFGAAQDGRQELGLALKASGGDANALGLSVELAQYRYLSIAVITEGEDGNKLSESQDLLDTNHSTDEQLAALKDFHTALYSFRTGVVEGEYTDQYAVDASKGTVVVSDTDLTYTNVAPGDPSQN